MDTVKGTCLCRKVQFQLILPTDFCAHCHCESCRLAHGAPFVTWTSVPNSQFRITSGKEFIRWYQSSEWIEWGFCSNCGSSMLYRAVAEGHPEGTKPGKMYVCVGNILDKLDRNPTARYSAEEEVDWLYGFNEIPRYRSKTSERL